MLITKTVQFLYPEKDADGLDVHYTVFIINSIYVFWNYGKEGEQKFEEGDAIDLLDMKQMMPYKTIPWDAKNWPARESGAWTQDEFITYWDLLPPIVA